MIQETFNPIDYGWQWIDDWYKWDYDAARKAALYDRNSTARNLRKQGHKVVCQTLKNQRISKGGIGSGHPHIERIVNVYMVTAY